MVIRIGINGFGRISRVIFRACTETEDLEVVAINDPVIEADYISYLIKFDTSHGKFKGTVTNTDKGVFVNGKCIKIFNFKQPASIPWCKAHVQYVVEAAGIFTALERASEHLLSDGVERVIVTAPSSDIPMVILGVNDHELNKDPKVVSCTSSTLYCLAPLIKILQDNYGVDEGFVTSIHAMTPSLKPIDGLCVRGKHWRDHRSINHNIIPTNTSACKALGKVIPAVKDKLSGIAFRVPVANVSVLDLSIKLSTETTLKDIIQKVRQATDIQNNNVIYLANNNEVSSDFLGEEHSCVLDIATCMALNTNFFKLVCWYENEYSYACRVIDTIHYFERRFPNPTNSRSYLKAPLKMSSERKRATFDSVICHEDPKLKKANTLPIFLKNMSNKQKLSGSGNVKTRRKNSDFDSLQEEEEGDRCMLIDSGTDDGREQSHIVRAHDRLQKLKDEFRKMVNKTEDLLKKSYNNRFRSISRAASISDSAEGNSTETGTKVGSGDNADVHAESASELYRNAENIDNIQNKKITQIKEQVPNVTLKLIDTNIIAIEEVDTQKHSVDRVSNSSIDQNFSTIFWNCSKKSNYTNHLGSEHKSTLTSEYTFIENRSTEFEILFDESRELLPEDVKPKSEFTELSTECGLIDPNLETKCGDSVFEKYKKQIDVKKVDGRIEISLKVPKVPTSKPTAEKEIRRRKKKSPRINVNNIKKDLANNLHVYQYTKNTTFIPRKRFTPPSPKPKRAKKKPNIYNINIPKIVVSNKRETSIVTESGISQSTSIEAVNDLDNAGDLEVDVLNYDNSNGKSSPLSISKINPATSSNFTPTMVEIEETEIDDGQVHTMLQDQSLCTSGTYPSFDKNEIECIIQAKLQPFNIDLYDKLEATSSTNSLKSRDGKSQIISVSDLTNSIEDLRKLNKICKILEVSDELSDKLFSPLGDASVDKREKKWSFKELCETIKLDDFFNNVFGKRINET